MVNHHQTIAGRFFLFSVHSHPNSGQKQRSSHNPKVKNFPNGTNIQKKNVKKKRSKRSKSPRSFNRNTQIKTWLQERLARNSNNKWREKKQRRVELRRFKKKPTHNQPSDTLNEWMMPRHKNYSIIICSISRATNPHTMQNQRAADSPEFIFQMDWLSRTENAIDNSRL